MLGGLELVSAVGLVDFRTVLATGGPDPRKHADNARDPELIHIHKPYLKRVGATRGDIALALHLADTALYPYDVACDGNGFRNACDLSTAEVVVLGDSFVEGGLVAADDLLTDDSGPTPELHGCQSRSIGLWTAARVGRPETLRRVVAPEALHLDVLWRETISMTSSVTSSSGRRSGPTAVRSTPWERSFGRNALRVLSERLGRFLTPDPADQAPWGTFHNNDSRDDAAFLPKPGCTALQPEACRLEQSCLGPDAPRPRLARRTEFRCWSSSCRRNSASTRDYCTFPPRQPLRRLGARRPSRAARRAGRRARPGDRLPRPDPGPCGRGRPGAAPLLRRRHSLVSRGAPSSPVGPSPPSSPAQRPPWVSAGATQSGEEPDSPSRRKVSCADRRGNHQPGVPSKSGASGSCKIRFK